MAILKGYDLLILLAIVLFLFGGTLIPRFARHMGEAVKEIKNINKSDDSSSDRHDNAA
jgi:Sec-independent protein translocase protein TatA